MTVQLAAALVAAVAVACARQPREERQSEAAALSPPPAARPATPKPTPVPSLAPEEVRRGFAEFERAVKEYGGVRGRAEKSVPDLPDKADPERIAAHEKALAEAIRRERASAGEGEMFTPAARAAFASVLRGELTGPGSTPARKTIEEGNPREEGGSPVVLKINATYPKDAPLSTMPPSLLERLPRLPEWLEYRFVGPHLVLHDSVANVIVDVLRNAAG